MLQKSFKSDIIKLVKLLTEVVLVEYSANLTLVHWQCRSSVKCEISGLITEVAKRYNVPCF